jgi:hypothetical protein
MKWHCGILDDHDPYNPSRTWDWVTRGGWSKPGFPEDVRREIAIFLATPGFSDEYLCKNLRTNTTALLKHKAALPGYDELWREVGDNWMSVTHEDAVRLCRLRVGKSGAIPLVCQFHMLRDLKADRTKASIAREYGVSQFRLRVLELKGIQPV